MAHVDRTKIKIAYDEDAELWFLTYDDLPKDTIVSYSSNYQFLYNMSVWAVDTYLEQLKKSYDKSIENLFE